MPFPDYCRDCMILASGACFNPRWQENKEILIFQVEASIACTLECPGCMTFAERRSRHGKLGHLDIKIFEKYLADFKADEVTIRTIDFQGHGEPLLNRDVWKMASLAKSYFPDANISMCTAAHGKFDQSQVHSGIDEMMFAIDGVDQKSFEPNRVRGDFGKAFGFMKSFCQASTKEGRNIKTVWKYILFDCNSSPEQLVKAQHLAAAAGVQELMFVNTQLGLKLSKIFTLSQIPKVDNGVKIHVSDYLSNFHDIQHSIDKSRFAMLQNDSVAACAHLEFATNMLRRRFECIEPRDTLAEDYQALVYEILDLLSNVLIESKTRTTIEGGLHAIQGKLVMGAIAAKNFIIHWKTEEIARLNVRLAQQFNIGLTERVQSKVKQKILKLEERFRLGNLSQKNHVIRLQTVEVHRLASLLNQQPSRDVSMMKDPAKTAPPSGAV